jgi:hypothetical protein
VSSEKVSGGGDLAGVPRTRRAMPHSEGISASGV